MPSLAHEVLVAALGDKPALLALAIEKLVGRVPPSTLTKVDSTVRFVDADEVRPDIVLVGEGQPWVIVEVQHDDDSEKARRWMLAAAALHDQTGAMGDLVVFVFRRSVARWARRVAKVQGPLGTVSMLRPVVLLLAGKAIEALLDETHPELALLAAWAVQHRHGPKACRIVERALQLTDVLPEPLRGAQVRAIYNVLSDRMLAILRETQMKLDEIPERPLAREVRLLREEGLNKARASGKATALLGFLRARGLAVTDEQHARILACTDATLLDRWIEQAAVASSVDDVLG